MDVDQFIGQLHRERQFLDDAIRSLEVRRRSLFYRHNTEPVLHGRLLENAKGIVDQ
jgi:hypothetical protein